MEATHQGNGSLGAEVGTCFGFMSDHKLAADLDSCLINTNDTIGGKMSDIWSDEETLLSTVRSGIVTVKMWVSSIFLFFSSCFTPGFMQSNKS